MSNLLPPPELRVIFGRLLSGKIDPKQFVESIKTRDNAHQVSSYFQRSFPSVYNVMITKRDVHMAMMLRRHCGKGKVVAVVGMAHMEGIEREWEKLDTTSNN
jgi:pheromone shutdown protein TraB